MSTVDGCTVDEKQIWVFQILLVLMHNFSQTQILFIFSLCCGTVVAYVVPVGLLSHFVTRKNSLIFFAFSSCVDAANFFVSVLCERFTPCSGGWNAEKRMS